MAAELEFRGDGQANMFFSKQGGTPWHREGVSITGDEVYDFDGLISKHFDYPLEKLPYFLPQDPTVEPDKAVYVQGQGPFYIRRADTGKVLGPVGSDYTVIQNREAFEVLKPLVDSRVAAIETGGVLRDGADAWLMVKWDLARFGSDVQEVFGRDGGLLPFSPVMVNHSGRRGVSLGFTSIRLVCANTVGMAEREADRDTARWRTITHRGDAKSKLVEAAQELFSNVLQKYEVIAKQYRLLMQCRLDEEAFDRLVLEIVAPDPRKAQKFNPEAKLAEVVVERAMTKQREIRRLFTAGKGHTGERTAWYAYQAVAEALDFNRDLWPTRAGSWRTASLLNGQLAELKNRVLDNLVGYAAAA